MSQGNALDMSSRALWLSMGMEQWWSALALAHHWRPTFSVAEVERQLNALASAGFLAERLTLTGRQYSRDQEHPAWLGEAMPTHHIAHHANPAHLPRKDAHAHHASI